MANNWYFAVGFVLLCIAISIDLYILHLQVATLHKKSVFQPIKKLLIAAIVTVALASTPLAFVYADILWIHYNAMWIVWAAVIGNSFAKVLFAFVYLAIYKY